ncbi:hypothetical protein BGP75_03680 [Motiliproteus sp. MSK22-1]|nr:hypothetical protein BGP75_03680 [Motiliproteus sp. MSK22-1]
MKKSTAHIILGCLDFAALGGLGYTILKVSTLWTNMSEMQTPLIVDTGVLYLPLLILVPLFHIMSAIEFFFPKHLKIQNRLGSALVVIFLCCFLENLLSSTG